MSRQRYTPKQLKELTARTVGHYQNRADDFWEGTRDHDVTQNINALLDPLQIPKGARILDFGCGPGRDIKAFQELGHVAIGLDGSEAFCAMARAYSGAEVWCQPNYSSGFMPSPYQGRPSTGFLRMLASFIFPAVSYRGF